MAHEQTEAVVSSKSAITPVDLGLYEADFAAFAEALAAAGAVAFVSPHVAAIGTSSMDT